MKTEAEKQAAEIYQHAGELASVLTDDIVIHSFIHCRACSTRNQTERLEVGMSSTGLVVQCKKHGIIVHYSTDQLREQLLRGPECDCCPGGRHRS